MVSGLFLLNPYREYGLRKLFCEKILRIMTAYLFWAIFYTVFSIIEGESQWKGGSIQDYAIIFVMNIIQGRFHMWFLFMITGLYLVTPILRQIVKNEKVTIYFLILWLVFGILNKLGHLPPAHRILALTTDRMEVRLVIGFSGYFLWGYYLSRLQLPPLTRKIIYIAGILAAIGTIGLNWIIGYKLDKTGEWMYDNYSPNIFLMTTAVFVFCQYFFQNRHLSQNWQKIISLVGKWSFGIYLVHIFYLDLFDIIGLSNFSCHPIVSIPLLTIACFFASLATVFFLSKIPVVNKYAI